MSLSFAQAREEGMCAALMTSSGVKFQLVSFILSLILTFYLPMTNRKHELEQCHFRLSIAERELRLLRQQHV